MSSSIAATPTVMAESATLNAQKCQPPSTTSTKSTTEPSAQAVDQVADRAAEDQRQADARQRARATTAAPRRARCRRAQRRGHERDDGRLVREVHRVQDAERRAGVPHVRQVQQARDDRDAVVQRDLGAHERLGHLVERRRCPRRERPRAGRRRGGGPPERCAGGRRRVIAPPPARPRSAGTRPRGPRRVDTAGTYRQHRSHFAPPAFAATMWTALPSPS